MNINADIDNFHVGFFLSAWWFGRLPKEKNGAPADSSERPFFRCVTTPDVLAKQQVTPVWQTSFSASVHTLAQTADKGGYFREETAP